MYTFEDKLNGESLTLRPEATAGIVRAAIEHSLTYERPQRVWTSGPMFRHERPQKGRYRQFHQLDVEALGFAGPDVDAEQIVMLARLWRALGTRRRHAAHHQLDRRPGRAPRASRGADRLFRGAARTQLDADAKRRLHTNPLRILDSKNPDMQELIRGAPKLVDRLGAASRAHFDGLQRLLADSGIALRDRRAAGARARLLQSDRVRVGHRPAGRAGHGRRRRPLRRPVRAAGRQAHAGLRLRHRRRADDPAAAGGRRDRRPRAARLRRPRRRRRRAGSPGAPARCCATPAARSSSTPAAAASSRR